MSVNSPVMYLCGLRAEIHWSTSQIDVLTKVKEAPQRNYTTTKHKGHCYWTSIMLHISRATQLFLSGNTSLGRHRAGINLAYLSKVSNYLVYLINRTRRILKWFCEIQRGLISYSLKKQIMVESLISLFNRALIRSNRGTSYTWHLVRLQEREKKGPALASPEEEASTSGWDKDDAIRQNSRTRELGEWGSELLKPHSHTKASFLRQNPDTHSWHPGLTVWTKAFATVLI